MKRYFHEARSCTAYSKPFATRAFVDDSEDEFEDRFNPQNWDDFDDEDTYDPDPIENDPYEDFDLDDDPEELDPPDDLWNDSDWD